MEVQCRHPCWPLSASSKIVNKPTLEIIKYGGEEAFTFFSVFADAPFLLWAPISAKWFGLFKVNPCLYLCWFRERKKKKKDNAKKNWQKKLLRGGHTGDTLLLAELPSWFTTHVPSRAWDRKSTSDHIKSQYLEKKLAIYIIIFLLLLVGKIIYIVRYSYNFQVRYCYTRLHWIYGEPREVCRRVPVLMYHPVTATSSPPPVSTPAMS